MKKAEGMKQDIEDLKESCVVDFPGEEVKKPGNGITDPDLSFTELISHRGHFLLSYK